MPNPDRHADKPNSLAHRRPPSCLSCKSRKLRCNRESPCSNCASRNISCQQPAPRTRFSRASGVDSQGDIVRPEILERLRRLEHILSDRQDENTGVSNTPDPVPPVAEDDSTLPPQRALSIIPQIQDLETDAVRLEKVCKVQNSLGSALSDGLTFRVCSLSRLISPITYIFQPSPSSFGIVDPVKCIWIPEQAETRVILAKFIEEVDCIRHIIHVPSLQPTIDSLYTCKELRDDAATGPLALLLSIIATVSHHWTHLDPEREALFASSAEAKPRTVSWAKAALDVIDYSARVGSNSLEHVQALLHVCYVLFHLEGFSTQLRSILGTTVTFARNLDLHVIDLPGSMISAPNPRSSVLAAEMGRRVWWSVVTLDWLLAQHHYPHGDFYLTNPKLMAVNLPRDCSDDQIESDEAPGQDPSPMTFHILKIRLAELCREFADHTFLGGGLNSETRYSHVMRSDAEMNRFIRELPPIFKLEPDASIQGCQRDSPSYRILATQSYMLNLGVQAQLCKLHFPYLFRATVDPSVSYSRQACLRAAQQVIRIELILEDKRDPPFLHNLFQHCGILYIISLASIVLLLDSCLGSTAGRHESPPSETLEAYRLLKNASEYSGTSEKLFKSLVQLLSKHRVSLNTHPSHFSKETAGAVSTEAPRAATATPEPHRDITSDRNFGTAPEVIQEQLLDELWQSVDNGMNIDDFDWKDLLAGVDSSFI